MLQLQAAPGSQWAPVHSSPPAKTLPQQQLLESNRGIRILQPQATAREVNCRNPTLSPGFQYPWTASDIKEPFLQDQHHWLGNPFHTGHWDRITWTQPQPLGACALLSQFWHNIYISSDVVLLCISGLKLQWGSSSNAMHRQVGRTPEYSCSGPCCWGWQHRCEAACPEPLDEGHLGMANPWLDVGVALAVSRQRQTRQSWILPDCITLMYW